MTRAALEFSQITHGYTDRPAVRGVSTRLAEGELMCLLGPSGCGKTTLLRVAAGLERPWEGKVTIGGQLVSGPECFVPPEQRRIGFVFQDYALFPHLTVRENVRFGLGRSHDRMAEQRIASLMERLGIAHLDRSYPHALSGGQQQRVALVRALAPGPRLLLLDEPFSGLDAVLRRRVYEELREVLTDVGVAALVVTHDAEEAMMLGHRIVVLDQGHVAQVGTPEAIYTHPASAFAMTFLGEANAFPIERSAGHAHWLFGPVPEDLLREADTLEAVYLRPEAITVQGLQSAPEAHELGAEGVVSTRIFVGRTVRLHIDVEARDGPMRVIAQVPPGTPFNRGDRVWVSALARDLRVF